MVMSRESFFLFHNWRAKLGALALATVLWLVIRYRIVYTPARASTTSAPTLEAVPRE